MNFLLEGLTTPSTKRESHQTSLDDFPRAKSKRNKEKFTPDEIASDKKVRLNLGRWERDKLEAWDRTCTPRIEHSA